MILTADGLQSRREAYFSLVRSLGHELFKDDGTYQPTTEADGRIAYWAAPAFLEAADAETRAFGRRIYEQGAGWQQFDIFMTSCVAAICVRNGEQLSPELRRRSEAHLAAFTCADRGRGAGAMVYDYQFHGYNDNMPSMATRTMALAGDILGRPDFTAAARFYLEGLCAHFERRGLLSEGSSPTYAPITLVSLLDVAECCQNAEVRELAQACANRVLLDLIGHWHWPSGTSGAATPRAYNTDNTETLSILNAYIWYISGHPACLDPCTVLAAGSTYDGPMHHARNRAFNIAQFVEVMHASHAGVPAGIRTFGAPTRSYPYEIRATIDWGPGWAGGGVGYETISYQQPRWWLASGSQTAVGSVTSQQLVLHGAILTRPKPASYRDRIAFWHRLLAGSPDQGEKVGLGSSPHAGKLTAEASADPIAEADHIPDQGFYQTVQQRGSAMVVGGIGSSVSGKLDNLRFQIFLSSFGRQPDEAWAAEQQLASWPGVTPDGQWSFLRFDTVYLGLRLCGMIDGKRLPVTRDDAHGYLRLRLFFGDTVEVTPALREWTDFGYVLELGDEQECGEFARFREDVSGRTWEFYHNFYRSCRYLGRHGELQIVDSPLNQQARFRAIDGRVVEPRHFVADGLDPRLVQLFPDGRRIVQQRISYWTDHLTTPYSDRRGQILASDISGP